MRVSVHPRGEEQLGDSELANCPAGQIAAPLPFAQRDSRVHALRIPQSPAPRNFADL